MPVGQSTETQEVATVQQTMTLDLSLDDFAAQRDALIQRLAAQYGVDASLITLEARAAQRLARTRALQAGGLELTITIATSDGSGNQVDISTIENAASAVDATTLAATISAVTVAAGLPPVIISALQVPERATAEIEVPFSCPRGKWCTAGLVVSCPLGTYNPLEDQDFATACVVCPLNSYTKETNSTSRSACVCDDGFYDANSSLAVDADLISAMISAGNDPVTMMAAVVDCHTCPVGTLCAQGSTLEALPLARGFFRVDGTTTDVRKCPDADANCSTTFGSDACESSSGCLGGTNASSMCAPGLTGTFCRTCDQDSTDVYYVEGTKGEEAHCEACGNNLPQTAALVALVLLALASALMLLSYAQRHEHFGWFMDTFKPHNKVHIADACPPKAHCANLRLRSLTMRV